ncbi:unnamed protein product [Linum tenue]|uniref:Uncharacterized protein n=1 Tax=Linum tenue TaxID=586396 RepID=A0AAV0S3X5_9ROSI|nr:unnamed protein product [Linum tenue]
MAEYGTKQHRDHWFLGFQHLMDNYFKGRVGKDVLPDLIKESILKFRAETSNKEFMEELQGVIVEKEAIIFRGDWILELQSLLREYIKGKKHMLPSMRRKLLKMRLSGKHDQMVTSCYEKEGTYRSHYVRYITTRAEYFDQYANLILPEAGGEAQIVRVSLFGARRKTLC